MLSPEFTTAIKSGALLRARIMLKDSLIVDPTFVQFNGMFAYARRELPDLLVPYDGEVLENDRTKWNTDLMNTELVEIVNNFSDVRIDHLKKVISVVLADNIKRASMTSSPMGSQTPRTPQSGASSRGASSTGYSRSGSPSDIEEQKKAIRKQALSQLTNSSKKIESVISSVQSRGTWMFSDIQDLEKAANQILAAAKSYKNNR